MIFRGLTARLLIFNLLLAVFPIGAFLFLGTYESQLLDSQERAMVQQGRLLASALEGHVLSHQAMKEEANDILNRLGARTDARLRVVDADGVLLADSARLVDGVQSNEPDTANTVGAADATETALREKPPAVEAAKLAEPGPSPDSEKNPQPPTDYPEESFLYRVGALPARTMRTLSGYLSPPPIPRGEAEYYSGRTVLNGEEVRAALSGRYGAATRISKGQRSVTLYSAIPMFRGKEIIGAVLISRSTYAILTDIYQLRLDIANIFLASIAIAIVLSLLLARTVTVPVGRLRDQAESLIDERGKLQAPFKPLSGKDEVADLSRALHELSSRLRERTDHLEHFMADLVHEMKNPVAGIISAAELADEASPEDSSRFLIVINREARRIERLLDDLKELISVDVRLNRGRREPVNVEEILTRLVAAYPVPRDKQVKLSLELPDDDNPPAATSVNADPDRLAQALINLIENAVSFSPDGETVDIVLEARRERPLRDGPLKEGPLRITVADRGSGISPNDSVKIFERWYTDRPDSEATAHTGLGLAIVKGIAEGYGGSAQAAPREGGGAVFSLEFP